VRPSPIGKVCFQKSEVWPFFGFVPLLLPPFSRFRLLSPDFSPSLSPLKAFFHRRVAFFFSCDLVGVPLTFSIHPTDLLVGFAFLWPPLAPVRVWKAGPNFPYGEILL